MPMAMSVTVAAARALTSSFRVRKSYQAWIALAARLLPAVRTTTSAVILKRSDQCLIRCGLGGRC